MKVSAGFSLSDLPGERLARVYSRFYQVFERRLVMHNGWQSKSSAARVAHGLNVLQWKALCDEIRAKIDNERVYLDWYRETALSVGNDYERACQLAREKLAELQNPLALVAARAGYEITEEA